LDLMDFHVSLVGRNDLSGEIYRQLRRAIVNGRLRRGELLPPTRELAQHLSVARTTVTVAYDRLAGDGVVTSRVGAGTFVNEHGAPAPHETKRRRVDAALRPLPIWDSIPLSAAPAPRRSTFAPAFPMLRCSRTTGGGG
jgi:GntR family transcriptional regulator/MocR family aminotransferase